MPSANGNGMAYSRAMGARTGTAVRKKGQGESCWSILQSPEYVYGYVSDDKLDGLVISG